MQSEVLAQTAYHKPWRIQVEQSQNLVKSNKDEGMEVTSQTPLPLPSKVPIAATNMNQ
jgi:hypothetical protein